MVLSMRLHGVEDREYGVGQYVMHHADDDSEAVVQQRDVVRLLVRSPAAAS